MINKKKFIPTKKDYLEQYLTGIKEIASYSLMEFYKGNYKYCKYYDIKNMKYTKESIEPEHIKEKEITVQQFRKEIDENSRKNIINRKCYIDKNFDIVIDTFLEPLEMIIVSISSANTPLDKYPSPKGFIEVSNLTIYENYEIYKGSVKSNHTIIEGTDGVGKSVTIAKLMEKGIIAQDRCMEVISPNMLFNIGMKERAKKYHAYLKNISKKIIFLVNNNEIELNRRIAKRQVVSEYDIDAVKYNKLYLDTYSYMKKNNMLENKLFLIDCTALTIEEQVNKVKDIINA